MGDSTSIRLQLLPSESFVILHLFIVLGLMLFNIATDSILKYTPYKQQKLTLYSGGEIMYKNISMCSLDNKYDSAHSSYWPLFMIRECQYVNTNSLWGETEMLIGLLSPNTDLTLVVLVMLVAQKRYNVKPRRPDANLSMYIWVCMYVKSKIKGKVIVVLN